KESPHERSDKPNTPARRRTRAAATRTMTSAPEPSTMIPAGPCVLRPWRADDLESLLRHADNLAVARQLRDAFPPPSPPAPAEAWTAIAPSQPPPLNFAIEHQGEAVGGIGLKPGTDVERVSAEIGYWLGERVWGRGLATAALRALVEHAFATTQLTRI